MNFQTKQITVSALQFDGTLAGVEDAREWLSSLDIENAEVSSQGDEAPYALDLITDQGLITLEATDWLICLNGKITTTDAESFSTSYEEAKC